MKRQVFMGAGEIRKCLGVSRQRAYQIMNRRDFPPPYQTLEMGKIWERETFEAWLQIHRPNLHLDHF
ncbi:MULTISPECIES: DNA-binding protein [Actinoplanes]|uniref:DNA-binding protein n=1 Tax=Actinoplanes TaxID=1865 RepID=UPI001FE06FEB|nr:MULTISPECIES: DNA-binding protein [Actinoplanes]